MSYLASLTVGNLVAQAITLPASCVGNNQIAAGAGILATKLQQQIYPLYAQSGDAAAATVVLHAVRGLTASVVKVFAGSVVAATGNSTVTVDVKKNGTSILSSTITLDNANTAYDPEAGTISTAAGVVDDVYTAVITVSAGTGTLPTGLYVGMVLREDSE